MTIEHEGRAEKTFLWLYRTGVVLFAGIAGWMGNAAYDRLLDVYNRLGEIQVSISEEHTVNAVQANELGEIDHRVEKLEEAKR